MPTAITYKVSRIFWSIYFAITLALVGACFGYVLTFFVYFLSFALKPWSSLSKKARYLAEDIQCLSIRMLLKMQPWLKCETNFYPILEFYKKLGGRRVVFVANHRSNLDTFLLISYIPGLRGLAKSTLFYNFLFAPFMLVMGFIPVDKGSTESFRKGLRSVQDRILKRDAAVLVFPENSRCDKDFPSVHKFSGAFFSLAIESEALIVPLVIESTDQILGRGDFFVNPYRPVRIQMLPPVVASEYTDFLQLRDVVWEQIAGQMKAAVI